MAKPCYINISGKEPYWVRWFGRLHWLWTGRIESAMIRRFRRKYDRINIYTRTPELYPEHLKELGEIISQFLQKHGYDDVRYDVLWGNSLQYSSPANVLQAEQTENEDESDLGEINFDWPEVPSGLAG